MVIALKVIAPVLVALLAYSFAAKMASPLWWIIYVVVIVVAYFVPDIVVGGRAAERQKQMMYDLPDILDQVTISIEAGMGFEAALSRVGSNNRGPLGEEIVRTVQDMNLGMPRRDSYLALAARNDVEDSAAVHQEHRAGGGVRCTDLSGGPHPGGRDARQAATARA